MSRGISEDSEIERMLMPMQQPLSDPFELIDMDKAVTRIRRAIDKHESMAIYGDYDVDGITATSLLYSYLCEREAKVTYMLPSRDEDGYGLHKKQIDELARFGVKLIITVDNGISAVEEVEYANSLGMDVVITDHHQPPDVLPDACAIVDAHRCDCPSSFKDYAGVGIAFKLVCALEGDSESVADKYADFVALGTVADVVPLRGENRSLVMRGLRLMQQESRLGLSVLMTFSSVNARRVSSGDISFVLSPRINSAGRIGKPDKAVRLMVSEDMEECRVIASELQSENARRHECERDIAKEAWQLIEKDRSILHDPVIVLCGEGWIHGVVGIFAARLCEQLGKPCIILSSDGEIAKGSGRCFGDFSLHEALTACAEHLIV
ncbi:MAG: single-stranded-DNA-specific exonuclease RecJ, partial [Clostridia bacterium]|nr:single-stranded-DNA-specific exonuclease RecJ [Clostridia bacterium]